MEKKKAKVTPLHKSGTKDVPRNYIISVLPVVSKVLGRLIHNQVASYFDDHNLLCKSQSGFRRMYSTETAVTYFADEILMNMDKLFDNFMTWKAHADYACKKVVSRVSILGRVKIFLTKEAATLVHNALVLPLFDYCDIVWSNLVQQDVHRLQRLQNRSARIIARCSRSFEAIEQLRWPTLSSRRSCHKAKLVFLCLHSLVPSYFSLYFTRFASIHNYFTRQSMRLSLPNVRQDFVKRTFLFTGAEIFNKLHLNVVQSENIQV